ncbi:(2,3-dihydroxybenzoyl)adenylate synthase [Brenneria tiliae]|uniref:AMP-binding protein n=1 Tax=Brenneria tiliae TaxID=2914984 RepID=A0ABT0N165_9GAMM|nr:AMP-binding protein [Brenneria tiliae]MCL2895830.1 AMP-binding protein [Brenneria tiliae]
MQRNPLYYLPEWPKPIRDSYFRNGWWNNETFTDNFKNICHNNKDKIAVNFYQQKLTYNELYSHSLILAKKLVSLGLAKGDIAIIHLPNSINFIEVTFGLMLAGIIPVFALPAHRENEILAFMRTTKAKAYIFQSVIDGFNVENFAQNICDENRELQLIKVEKDTSLSLSLKTANYEAVVLPKIDPDDLVCFQLSGGTTGIPKLIPRRHRDYLCNIRSAVKTCHFNASTVYLAVLPMSHNFPLACPGFIGTLFSGGRVVISDKNYPDHCFTLIEQQKVTVAALVPPLALVWLDAAEIFKSNLGSLQVLQVGGAKMSYEAAKRVKPILGCTLQQVYGMAEGLICFTHINDTEEIIYSTQGKPMTEADEIRVVDEQGCDLPIGKIGYLLTRGPYTICGYYGSEEINKDSFTSDGYYRSGDLVRMTPDGYLIVEGRDKDQINRGGEKINPEELENTLLRHHDVIDVAVVGINDDYMGECVCAFVLRRNDNLSETELRQFLQRQGIATFKIPDRFQFPKNFDLTGVGKVNKKELRERLKNEYILSLPKNNGGIHR